MRSSLFWAIILAVGCIVCMILFNGLASRHELTRDAYLSYASYAFDCLKVIFGMILGALTEKFHTRQQEKAYQEKIQNLQNSAEKQQ